jgi:hypothetical protein
VRSEPGHVLRSLRRRRAAQAPAGTILQRLATRTTNDWEARRKAGLDLDDLKNVEPLLTPPARADASGRSTRSPDLIEIARDPTGTH